MADIGMNIPAKLPKDGRKGEFILEIIEAQNLPKADMLMGKSDPYVKVIFSSGETAQLRKTKTISRNLNPQWNEEFKFKIFKEEDIAALYIYDHDKAGSDDIICEAPPQTFGGPRGSEGDEWIDLIEPKSSKKSLRLKSTWGKLHIKWSYNYSAMGDLFAADDSSDESEEEVSLPQLLDSVSRLGGYAYNAAALLFGAADLMMWSRPFMTVFILLFTIFSTLFARSLLDALLPFLVVVAMGRTYFMRLRYGSDWDQKGQLPTVEMPPYTPASTVPGAKLRRTMPTLKKLLEDPSVLVNPLNARKYKKLAYTWVSAALVIFDAISDVLAWRNEAVAQMIARASIVATVFVYYFGIPWGLWKLGLLGAVVLGTTVIPCYYMFPKMRDRMDVRDWLAWLTEQMDPYTQQVMNVIPVWAGGNDGRPTHLPPVPPEPRKYDEWKDWHHDREDQRRRFGVSTPRTSGAGGPTSYAAAMAAQPPVEVNLRIEVLSARKLQPKLADLCPYVKVTLHSGQKFKTKPATDASCQWDIAFTFRGLSEEALRSRLSVELFSSTTPSTLLGIGLLHMDSQTGMSDVWLPIREPGGGDTCGEVRLCLRTERGVASSRTAVPKSTAGRPPIAPTPGTVTATSPPIATSPSAKEPAPVPPPAMSNAPSEGHGGGGGGATDVIRQIDALWEASKYGEIYPIACQAFARDPGNFELVWRHARACYDFGGEKPEKTDEQKTLYQQGLDSAMKAKDMPGKQGDKNAWKWAAILQGKMKPYLPTKEGIARVYDMLDWSEKARTIDPTDDVVQHLAGALYFGLASLSWLERQAASALFGKPPDGTYEQALPFLLESDKLRRTHHNSLMLGNCYSALKQKENAKKAWQAVLDQPAITKRHEGLQNDAKKLL